MKTYYICTSINLSRTDSDKAISQWLNDNAAKGYRLVKAGIGSDNGIDHALLVMEADATDEKQEKKP